MFSQNYIWKMATQRLVSERKKGLITKYGVFLVVFVGECYELVWACYLYFFFVQNLFLFVVNRQALGIDSDM